MAPVVLAYWDIRGLAQPARLLLAYTGTEFEDKHYVCGPPPNYDKTCWFGVKESLGLDFPNLPYLIDGDKKITQSNAIMRYLGRKNGLDGKTEDEKIRVDMMENESMDFRNGLVRLVYAPDFEQKRPEYVKDVQTKLTRFSAFLGGRKWFAGDSLTFPDFIMYELLDQHRVMEPTILDGTPNLKQFLDRFEALPEVKAYMSSDRFMKAPLNNKMAKFGAGKL